jgi:hypothetical protein
MKWEEIIAGARTAGVLDSKVVNYFFSILRKYFADALLLRFHVAPRVPKPQIMRSFGPYADYELKVYFGKFFSASEFSLQYSAPAFVSMQCPLSTASVTKPFLMLPANPNR